MNTYSDKQVVELFHLLFLAQLGAKLDKRRFVLKGGCNLRFFLKSPRYSEAMDLDASGVPVDKLEEKVGGILRSSSFAMILQSRGVRIAHINDDKQTQTTQKWKLGLIVERTERPLPTKIEFSRRGAGEGAVFESIDPLLIGGYQLPPFMTSHYPMQAAYQQKVSALIDRAETQARDVFDLHLLLSSGVKAGDVPQKLRGRLGEARDHVMALEYPVFKGQVLAYLQPEQQELYDAKVWDTMRLLVIEAFEKVEHETA